MRYGTIAKKDKRARVRTRVRIRVRVRGSVPAWGPVA